MRRGGPPRCVPCGAVESEAAVVPGYVNRPTGQTQHKRVRIGPVSTDHGRRPAMRIAMVALRAYEQRSERRAALRAWLSARRAAASAQA